MFSVEKNVPVPLRNHKKAWILDLFNSMDVGDSFVIPKTDMTYGKYNSITGCARTRGFTITSRKQADGGTRIWMLSKPAANTVEGVQLQQTTAAL